MRDSVRRVSNELDGGDILAAEAACRGFLEPAAGMDWTVAVPGLDFTVASVVAHAANGPLWYALDLWGGAADAAGFAAMACDELLIHTDDAARGLGLRFAPDPALAGRVLARLFPWHQPGDDPWRALLWANGRIDWPGRPSQAGWIWHCAPLEDWDGRPPVLR
jgi:hypothetical protein